MRGEQGYLGSVHELQLLLTIVDDESIASSVAELKLQLRRGSMSSMLLASESSHVEPHINIGG